MSCLLILTRRPIVIAAMGLGFAVPPGVAYATAFNQNLRTGSDRPSEFTRRVQNDVDPQVAFFGSREKGAPASEPQRLAQAKVKAPQPTPVIAREPSSAEIVNKMLSPGPSDPNVPLPRTDLAGDAAQSGPAKSSPIYGRVEDGGAVLGFRVPIPADRNAPSSATRYGGTATTPEVSQQTR